MKSCLFHTLDCDSSSVNEHSVAQLSSLPVDIHSTQDTRPEAPFTQSASAHVDARLHASMCFDASNQTNVKDSKHSHLPRRRASTRVK